MERKRTQATSRKLIGWTTLALTGALTLDACNAHVQLPAAPAPTAPANERVGFYRSYRPIAAFGTMRYTVGTFGAMGPVTTTFDHLQLANGTAVSNPTDLTQVVGEDSPTAQAARSAESSQDLATGFLLGGVGLSITGLILALTGMGSFLEGDRTTFWVGAGVMVGGSVMMSIGRWGFGASAASQRAAAFGSYEGSLRTRLGVCGEGEYVHDCAPGLSAPSATAPTPWPRSTAPSLPPPPPSGSASENPMR